MQTTTDEIALRKAHTLEYINELQLAIFLNFTITNILRVTK